MSIQEYDMKSSATIGTELKINVNICQIDGYHMSDFDFTCRFFVHPDRYVDLKKEEMIRIDDDNYVACIDSRKVGIGLLMLSIVAEIPDSDFQGTRKEVVTVNTYVTIIR